MAVEISGRRAAEGVSNSGGGGKVRGQWGDSQRTE